MINLYFVEDGNRHVCEIQIVHKQMLVARASLPGHFFYAITRNAMELYNLFAGDFTSESEFSDEDNNAFQFVELNENTKALQLVELKESTVTECSFPRPVRDPVKNLCRRRRSSDCVSTFDENTCYKFNDNWASGRGQIIHGYDESGCLDKFGRNLEKNHLDPITQECIGDMNGHRHFWGRQFLDTCKQYINGKMTYLEAQKIAEDIFAVNNEVPSAVL